MKTVQKKNYWDVTQTRKIEEIIASLVATQETMTLWFSQDSKRIVLQGKILKADEFRFIFCPEINDLLSLEQEVYFYGPQKEIFFKTKLEKIFSGQDVHYFSFFLPSYLKTLDLRKENRFSFEKKKHDNELVLLSEKNNTRYLLFLHDLSKEGASFITRYDAKNTLSPEDTFRIEYISSHQRPHNLKARVVRTRPLDKKTIDGSNLMEVGIRFNENLPEIHHELVEVPLMEEKTLGLSGNAENEKGNFWGGLSFFELQDTISQLKTKNKISANRLVRNINALNVQILSLGLKEKYALIQQVGITSIAYALRTCYPGVVKKFMEDLRKDFQEELEYIMGRKQPLAFVLKKQDELLSALK